MSYLFLFTIGPVKSFIENSRKAMDLYAGSRFLSELMADAVGWLDCREGVQILFPVIAREEDAGPANIPNRLMAEFQDISERESLKMAGELADYIKNVFHLKCLDLLKEAGISQGGINMAERQWKDFLEVYWIFEEYDSDYSELYQKLFTRIQEVKGIRPFFQTSEPWGRKCMLFPEFNAIFAKKKEHEGKMVYPYQVNPDYVCDITENRYLQYVVKTNEALSSIGLVKRIYGKKVAEIYSVRYMLLKSRVDRNVFEEVKIQFQSGEQKDMTANAVYDLDNGQVLKEEEYPKDVILKAQILYQLIKEKKIILSSYYAIIKFDGDSMGEAFKALKTAGEQQELSSRISRFAHEAPKIIFEYNGLPVYAGGEDFMGYVPLDGLFACVGKLHEEFQSIVRMNFSAGISIAHLMQPLKEVLAYADDMETSAKQVADKNAFAVSIMKRSGNIVKIPAYKLAGNGLEPQWKDFGELVTMLKNSQCSKSLFFNVSDQLKSFIGKSTKPESAMIKALLKGCVVRASVEDDQIDREKMVDKLMLFYNYVDNLENFLNTLDGITFLSREVV